MSTITLTKVQKTLLYGLKLFKVSKENAVALVAHMEENEQLLLIHYMKTHMDATAQEVVNEAGRIIKQTQQKQQKSSES